MKKVYVFIFIRKSFLRNWEVDTEMPFNSPNV